MPGGFTIYTKGDVSNVVSKSDVWARSYNITRIIHGQMRKVLVF